MTGIPGDVGVVEAMDGADRDDMEARGGVDSRCDRDGPVAGSWESQR
jgi:hypothetical protein